MEANVLDVIRAAHDAAYRAYSLLSDLEDVGDLDLDGVVSMADELQAALFDLIEN